MLQSYGATITPKPNTFPPHFFAPVDFEEDLPHLPPTSSPPLLGLFETEPQLPPHPQSASVEIPQQTFHFAGTSPSGITPVAETTSSTLSPLQKILLEYHQKISISSQISPLPPAGPPPPPANPPLPIPDNSALPVAHVNRLPDTNALQLVPNTSLPVPQPGPAQAQAQAQNAPVVVVQPPPAHNPTVATVNSTASPSLAILKNPSWSEASLAKALHNALRPFIINQDISSLPQDNIPAQRGPKNFVLDFANAKLPKPGNFILFAGLPTPSKVQGDFGHLTVDESELPEPKPFPLINYNSEAILDNNAFQIQAGNGQFIVPVDNQLNPNPLLKPVPNLAPNKEIDLFAEEPGNDESVVTLQTFSTQSWATDPQPIQTEGIFRQDTSSTIRETKVATSSIQFPTAIISTTEKTLEPTKIYSRESSARNDSNNSEVVDSSVSPITESSKRLNGELPFNKTDFINAATGFEHHEESFAPVLPIKPLNVEEEEVYDLNFVVQLNQTVGYNSSSDTTNVTARPSTSQITTGKTSEIIQRSRISVSESTTTKQGDENVDEEDLSQFELFINNPGQTLSLSPSNSSSTTKSLESSSYSKITTEDLVRTTKDNVLLQSQTPEFIRISSQSSASILTNEAKNPTISLRQILTNYLNATQEPIISVQPISELVSLNEITILPSSSSSLSVNSISSSSVSTTAVPDDSTDQISLSSRSREKVTVLPNISYSTSKLYNVTSPTPTSTIPSSSSSASIIVSTSTTTQAVSTSTTPSVSSSVPIFISTSNATIKQPFDIDNSRSSEKFSTSSRLLSTLESTTIAPFTKVTSLESTSSHFSLNNNGVVVANSNTPTSSKAPSTESLVSSTIGNIKISTSNLKSAELQTATKPYVPSITTSVSSTGSSFGIQLVTNATTPSSLSNTLPSLETKSSVSVNANKTVPISSSVTAINLPIFNQNFSLSSPSLGNSVIIQNTNPVFVPTSSTTKLSISSTTYPSVIVFGKKPGEFASSNPLDSSVWIPVQQIRRKVSPDVVEINGNFVQPTSSETKDKSGFINLLNHLIVPSSTEGPHVPCKIN